MDTSQNTTVAEFRRKLCEFYGYDEKLTFIRTAKRRAPAKEEKARLEPRDFLNSAIEDSTALDKSGDRVNCLSNCKRAIDSQVDQLIRRLGYSALARKERWDIPTKFEFIGRAGIVTPRILNRINHLRNRVEHEFAAPSRQQVEDALDVTMLFLSYAELVHVPSLNWTLSDKLTVRYDDDQMVFAFFDKDPDHSDDATLLFSLAHGESGFDDFYNFLSKTVPLMGKNSWLEEDIP